MSSGLIETDLRGGVLLIKLNRPERLNAQNEEMLHELVRAYDAADADNDVRVIVVTGNGRAFCAGADLGSGDHFDHSDDLEHRDLGGVLNLRAFDLNKPVIAAINGPAVGLGATMTLPMDIRMAADNAKIGFVFARRGIVADGCASWFLPRLVGVSKALEWTMSGEIFGAAEALEAGLVRSVHPADELLPAALELARKIALNTSALSVTMNRQLMWRMLGESHPMTANEVESRALRFIGASAEAHEGVTAFLEKRPPVFPGRVPADLPEFYPWWEERKFVPIP